MLAHRQVEALDKGRVDLPTARREHLLDGRKGPEHHAVTHAHQAPPAHGLDHLRVEQPGPGHPAGLGRGPGGLTTCGLHPLPIVGIHLKRDNRWSIAYSEELISSTISAT